MLHFRHGARKLHDLMRAKQLEAALPRSVAGKMLAVVFKPLRWSGLSCMRRGAVPGTGWVPIGSRLVGINGGNQIRAFLSKNPQPTHSNIPAVCRLPGRTLRTGSFARARRARFRVGPS